MIATYTIAVPSNKKAVNVRSLFFAKYHNQRYRQVLPIIFHHSDSNHSGLIFLPVIGSRDNDNHTLAPIIIAIPIISPRPNVS